LVISFETLNPATNEKNNNGSDNINNVHLAFQPNASSELPKSPIFCKPFENAYEEAFKKGGINPQRTVR
jgi:putative hydrolase of the HAD superfamily